MFFQKRLDKLNKGLYTKFIKFVNITTMNSIFKSEIDIITDKTGGTHLPLAFIRAFFKRDSFPGYNADFRPLPLMDSMCPVCACTGAGCGEPQDV